MDYFWHLQPNTHKYKTLKPKIVFTHNYNRFPFYLVILTFELIRRDIIFNAVKYRKTILCDIKIMQFSIKINTLTKYCYQIYAN